VAMPIIDIQPALKQPQNYYYAAEATAIDAQARLLVLASTCELSTACSQLVAERSSCCCSTTRMA
jgi:hypothetical protein